MNKKAFTLAEVLITLGVIGVVATLTLPALLTSVINSHASVPRDDSKLANYGLSDKSGALFYVWSGQETSSYDAFYRGFAPSYTTYFNANRNDSGILAVCKN